MRSGAEASPLRHAMFIRFVTTNFIPTLRVAAGVFTIACDVMEDWRLPSYERSQIRELLVWFGRNLPVPPHFCRSSRDRDQFKAICWFKPSATMHIRTMREMVSILDRHDYFIRTIKTAKPGYVVYQDDFQIAAEPIRDLRC